MPQSPPFTSQPIVRVAVPGPFSGPLDYVDPDGSCLPGCRAAVPLGRRNVCGLVLSRTRSSDVPAAKLKPVQQCLDATPLLPPTLMKLLQWTADYYHFPIGDTCSHALTGLLRRGADLKSGASEWRLTESGRQVAAESLSRAPRQQALLSQLYRSPLSDAELAGDASGRAALQRLREKGWVEQRETEWTPAVRDRADGPPLNPEQKTAVAQIRDSANDFAVHLLQGVTGSGKTEVYLQVIESLGAGRQALVLVPEIALTPQLLSRFARLGLPMVSLHSGMAEGERRRAWTAARGGKARIIVGTRSAVFVPLANPGLVIVDEEHDPSFKQQEGLRYNARDVAVRRAQLEDIPVVLGSATPSLESLANVEAGRYSAAFLTRRAGRGQRPAVRLVDLRGEPMQAGLSSALIQAIDQHVSADSQVMLFLNRRGYAPAMLCHECGWSADCRRCDARMTVHHQQAQLHCHHCGASRPVPLQCPECDSHGLIAAGQGTERIEERVRRLFPDQAVARLDRDSTRRRGSLENTLEAIRSGKARIVIGTQMLAKGHDFPNVTLAAVVNADAGLFAVDFRAAERMAQLVTQFAGRAGRGNKAGEVIVQTHQPEHPLLIQLATRGYEAFAGTALQERREGKMPPFGFLALLRGEAVREDAVRDFLQRAAKIGSGSADVELWGPAPAPMLRRSGRYRLQLLIHATQRPALHRFLRHWLPLVRELKHGRRVRWSIDVDPVDLY